MIYEGGANEMPLDGAMLKPVCTELNNLLSGGRIEKIYQPEKDELVFSIRSNFINYRLVMSASPENPRVHLTNRPISNPLNAPMFCMLLRKRLTGAKIVSVRQKELERIVEMGIDAHDELSRPVDYTLCIEIMGKHSNIILASDGVIIDVVKRIDEDLSRVRQVLPQIKYEYPPAQEKLSPLLMDKAAFHDMILSIGSTPLSKGLSENLLGLSRNTARYIGFGICDMDSSTQNLTGAQTEALADRFNEFYRGLDKAGNKCFLLLDDGSSAADFYIGSYAPVSGGNYRELGSPNELLDEFYYMRDLESRLRENTNSLSQTVKTSVERLSKKISKIRDTLDDVADMDKYRLYGELLTAYQGSIGKGAASAKVINYYDESGATVEIPLDPEKNANINAQSYYKRYQKLKRAQDYAAAQLEEAQAELDYLEDIQHQLQSLDDEAAAQEIRQELESGGYIRSGKRRNQKAVAESRPRHYVSEDGYDIYIGRNNKQNDQLTMRSAKNEDMWLHTKDIAGSHVIIRADSNKKISQNAINTGAMLAAWYSKARGSSNVPVDYTLKKNLRKPAGAKPGYVIFLSNNTINVTCSATDIAKIKRIDD